MTDDPKFQQWLELSWRGDLSGREESEFRAWLKTHPEAQEEWELDNALNEVFERLPEAEVPSNFTARVLEAVEREAASTERRNNRPGWKRWTNWMPRLAFAVMIVGAGVFSYHELQISRRVNLARSVEAVAQVSSLPSPAILEDFEAIRRLTPSPTADETLLSLLQ